MKPKTRLRDVSEGSVGEREGRSGNNRLAHFARGLRKRKVCRTAISYILVMWLNLQIGDVLFPMLGLPDWSLSLIITIGLMGFPVVLILAWAFQITPDGIVLDRVHPEEGERQVGQQLDLVVDLLLLVFSVALSILLVAQFLSDSERPREASTGEMRSAFVITAVSIGTPAEDPDNVALASGVTEELRQALFDLEDVELLPEPAVLDPSDDRQRLSVTGTVYRDGGRVHVLAQVINLTTGRYVTATAFNVEAQSMAAAGAVSAAQITEALVRALSPDAPAQ